MRLDLRKRPTEFKYELKDVVLCTMTAGILNTSYAVVIDRKRSKLTGRNLYRLKATGLVDWRPESAIVEKW